MPDTSILEENTIETAQDIIHQGLERVLDSPSPMTFVNKPLETTTLEAQNAVETAIKEIGELAIEKIPIDTKDKLQMRDLQGALVTGSNNFEEFPFVYIVNRKSPDPKIPYSAAIILAKLTDERVVVYIGKRTSFQQFGNYTKSAQEVIHF